MSLDPKTVSIAKEKAEGLLSKGRLSEALAEYEKIKGYGEKDPMVYLRMGDIARRSGDNAPAIAYYRLAIESFARLGFLIKAVAVCKVIIGIDPALEDVQGRLAALCAAQSRAATGPVGKEEAKVPRTPLFSDLSEDEFIAVVRKVSSRKLARGEFLFRESDAGDSIFLVAEGAVEVVGRAKDGKAVALAILKDGSIFGEFGFFMNARRSSGVVAAEGSTILEIKKSDLEETIKTHPRVEEILFNFYKERVVDRLMALSEMFGMMSAADRGGVLRLATLEKFQKGSAVTKEGEAGETMYLIKSGKVSVSVDKGGKPIEITGLEEGDFFGEIALATSHPRVATVTALTDLELVSFSRRMIKDVIGKYPELRGVLEKVVRERVVDIVRAKKADGAFV